MQSIGDQLLNVTMLACAATVPARVNWRNPARSTALTADDPRLGEVIDRVYQRVKEGDRPHQG
jgi:hypothetical protein